MTNLRIGDGDVRVQTAQGRLTGELLYTRFEGQIKGRASWAAARSANWKGVLKQYWNQLEICWTFEILNTYSKNIGLKGRQIISLPGAPICLGPVLHMIMQIRVVYKAANLLITREITHLYHHANTPGGGLEIFFFKLCSVYNLHSVAFRQLVHEIDVS
jgi:hypothetical protein